VLAYQYLQTLPQLAQAEGNTFWVIPSEVTTALRTLSTAFGGPAEGAGAQGSAGAPGGRAGPPAGRVQMAGAAAALTGDGTPANPVPNGEAARAATAASARDEVLRVEREVAALEREAADAERGTGHAMKEEPGEPARDVRA
jgi:hypothetical protein